MGGGLSYTAAQRFKPQFYQALGRRMIPQQKFPSAESARVFNLEFQA